MPSAARAQLLGQYYPVGIPGYQNWFADAAPEGPPSEYSPLGVRAGSFLIHPSLSEGLGYNSDIFGTAPTVGSAFAETKGRVAAGSDWSRDALTAAAGFDNMRFWQHPGASYTDWSAALGGVLDLGPDRATAAYAHVVATTVSAQIGTLGAGQQVTIALDSARASYQAVFGNFSLEPEVAAETARFASAFAGGSSEAANDHDTFSGALTGSFQLAPGRSLVLVANAASAAYTTRIPGVPAADYDDLSLVGGIDYRSGSLFRYRATLGIETRSYVNAQLPGTSAPLAELDVIWTPTRLTTLTGQASHSLQNAIATGVAESYAYTDLRLSLDHAYRRNVLLEGFAELQNAGYQTRGETQRVVSAGASVNWLLDRRVTAIGRVTWSRSSDTVERPLNQTGGLAELTLDFHL